MFDNIAHRYDFLNRFLSVGIDTIWRKRVLKLLKKDAPKTILDVATGTGDLAIELSKLDVEKITGLDISKQMLEKARVKVRNKKLTDKIEMVYGDSENLSFSDNSFSAATVSFGVRNFGNLEKGLSEINRVLESNGRIVVLEFSKPTIFPVKQVFGFYFKVILPLVGRFFSKDPRAYTYLQESVQAFPEGKAFLTILDKTGFKNTECIPLTFGICSMYTGTK
ncbi:UNVERIFIED_CONTAM: hypothetical protein GTU68_002863 [Idotea baltica]|nr:hypothetical protein [Idotea baltica]